MGNMLKEKKPATRNIEERKLIRDIKTVGITPPVVIENFTQDTLQTLCGV